MAVIEYNSEIPNNIVCLPVTETRLVREHYERGDLVILTDVRINADFDCIAAAEPTGGIDVRRQKFVFRKRVKGKTARRETIWERFFGARLVLEPAACEAIQDAVEDVDTQVDVLVRRIFNRHRFSRDFTAWKFLSIAAENLHIDNLPNLNDSTQVRLFVNVDNKPRLWSVGRHWRHYAERYFTSANLHEVADDATAFNGRLNHTAFGPSWQTCDERRHLVEFEPGEVWLINSAIVAHQVRGGNRLCSAHYEYAYRKCIERKETLPELIRTVSLSHGWAPQPPKRSLSTMLSAIMRRRAA